MTDYEFTLKFSLPDADGDPERHIEALSPQAATTH